MIRNQSTAIVMGEDEWQPHVIAGVNHRTRWFNVLRPGEIIPTRSRKLIKGGRWYLDSNQNISSLVNDHLEQEMLQDDPSLPIPDFRAELSITEDQELEALSKTEKSAGPDWSAPATPAAGAKPGLSRETSRDEVEAWDHSLLRNVEDTYLGLAITGNPNLSQVRHDVLHMGAGLTEQERLAQIMTDSMEKVSY